MKTSMKQAVKLSPLDLTNAYTDTTVTFKNHNTVASGGHPNTTQLIHAVILPAAGSRIQEILSILSCETTVQILLTVCLFVCRVSCNTLFDLIGQVKDKKIR